MSTDEPSSTPDVTFVSRASAARNTSVQARVQLLSGPDAPLDAPIGTSGITIGTGAQCELRLTDQRVSRTHVHVLPDADAFRVRDLGSTNGTFLDGARLDAALVPHGAVITIGHSVLRLLPDEPLVPASESTRTSYGKLVGTSREMRAVFGLLERVASATATVLIEGETGTGKELVARAVHSEGPRSRGPFVVVDCSAIASSLIESELFGHVRGAFTGAVDSRAGAFERADGGVLFLDELGELPLELQPKLLRALESRQIRKVGGAGTQAVDVRVVAGTNRDLAEMVDDKTFRSDLYYRLAVVQVKLPSLSERPSDLPILVEQILRDLGITDPGPIVGTNFSALKAHDWPGNVRELRNVLQRAVACADSPSPRFTDLALQLGHPRPRKTAILPVDIEVPFVEAKQRVVDTFELAYLSELYLACERNIAAVSRRAGVSRRHLYTLLRKAGVIE